MLPNRMQQKSREYTNHSVRGGPPKFPLAGVDSLPHSPPSKEVWGCDPWFSPFPLSLNVRHNNFWTLQMIYDSMETERVLITWNSGISVSSVTSVVDVLLSRSLAAVSRREGLARSCGGQASFHRWQLTSRVECLCGALRKRV